MSLQISSQLIPQASENASASYKSLKPPQSSRRFAHILFVYISVLIGCFAHSNRTSFALHTLKVFTKRLRYSNCSRQCAIWDHSDTQREIAGEMRKPQTNERVNDLFVSGPLFRSSHNSFCIYVRQEILKKFFFKCFFSWKCFWMGRGTDWG